MRYATIDLCGVRSLGAIHSFNGVITPLIAPADDAREYAFIADIAVNTSDFRDVLTLCALHADTVIALDGQILFSYIDSWATMQHLPRFEELNDNSKKRKRLTCEAWSSIDSEAEPYSRKVWIRVKDATRHTRLKTVTFFNFSALVGTYKRGDIAAMLGMPESSTTAELICRWDSVFRDICGRRWLGECHIGAWTAGGMSRQLYLKMRYPDAQNGLRTYQIQHPQNKELEYRLRAARLVAPGLLICTPGREFKNVYKYDVNSLFPAYVQAGREFTAWKACSALEAAGMFGSNGNKSVIYILAPGTIFKRRAGKPSVFYSPFDDFNNKEIFSIDEEFAIFRYYLDALAEFYEIYNMRIIGAYCANTVKDSSAARFVHLLYNSKREAGAAHNTALRNFYKLILNNFHGKLLQKTFKIDPVYTIENGIVERKFDDENLTDEWETKHFDFIRGADVYTGTRAYMLDIVARICNYARAHDLNASDLIAYSDTDSIITPLKPEEFTRVTDSPITDEISAWKIEQVYSEFCAIAPKIYYGRDAAGEFTVTAAGFNKAQIKADFEHSGLTPAEFFKNCTGFAADTVIKCQGGAYRATIYKKLTTQGD